MYTFKLNAGSHSEAMKHYGVGDTITTETDLRKFNTPRVTPRFELLTEEVSKEPEEDLPLEEMHVKTLAKMAREQGIDTTDLKTREDFIAALE